MRTRAKSHQQQQQGCALPQRNSSSDAPPLSTKPFLSQDVFRLVVRLEAQKVLGDVDVGALERKFRVPLGYSEEDTHRKQEKLELDVRIVASLTFKGFLLTIKHVAVWLCTWYPRTCLARARTR